MRVAAGTSGSVVSKTRTGTSRAPGTDAGNDKGAQCRGPGLGLLVAHGKEGSGRGGGVNGMKMNGSPLPLFINQLDNRRVSISPRATDVQFRYFSEILAGTGFYLQIKIKNKNLFR